MDITYTRTLTPEESLVVAGIVRDVNADRVPRGLPAVAASECVRERIDIAIDEWIMAQARKSAMQRAAAVDALPLSGQLQMLGVVDAKLAELDARKGDA